ncbi:hypothetical protein chiPu_0018201 [Chiloscyllium punctatum]|uniref:Uncharacterized protein n=1 Tax=Chiloscyllium punctatum TaxID=137246 RepID=A0A401RLP3_CHIPU|nr:hypothetical protein [Chiloscyllium punctatum]
MATSWPGVLGRPPQQGDTKLFCCTANVCISCLGPPGVPPLTGKSLLESPSVQLRLGIALLMPTLRFILGSSNEFRKRGRSLKILADFAKTIQIQLPNETFHAVSFKNPRGTAPLQHLFLKGFLIYNYTVSTLVPPDGCKLIALNDFPEFFREGKCHKASTPLIDFGCTTQEPELGRNKLADVGGKKYIVRSSRSS